jgi:ABC-2 type transport system ATP-binding protein
MDTAISCKGLRKVYLSGFLRRKFVGLHGLDLDVHRGEIFGFIGPNGAGKTTTIKILMGLQSATAGEATLLGIDHRDPESKRKVGFLPERPYFYEHLTAREFLRFYGQLFDLRGAELSRRIERLLERVKLERHADVPLREFSKGMLQRAGLAQALINDPELVVLDEPMSGLDPTGRMLVRDIIFDERRQGRTVFFSSHVLADVQLICDRVGIIVGGELRGAGTVHELVGRRVEHVDCAFRVDEAVALPGERIRVQDGVVQQRLAPEEVDGAVDAVRAAGGDVLEVQPLRPTLEEILVDEIERQKPTDPKRMGVLA